MWIAVMADGIDDAAGRPHGIVKRWPGRTGQCGSVMVGCIELAAMNGHTDAVNALAGTHGANVDAVDGRWLDGVDVCRLRMATRTL